MDKELIPRGKLLERKVYEAFALKSCNVPKWNLSTLANRVFVKKKNIGARE